MAKPRSVARSIRLFADRTLSPAALSAKLAQIAIQERDALVKSGEAPPSWTTTVDGRLGAPETSVRPDGFILYKFNTLGLAVKAALQICKDRSPVRSGIYRDTWIAAVDGKLWRGDLSEIPDNVEIMIVNPQPYARKIDTGAMKGMSVPPGIVEAARQYVQRQFPTVTAQRAFVSIPAGLFNNAPYILRRSQGRSKDRTAGKPITYPALILKRRI